ncbi:thioesterase [Oceanicola sp. 22II-s10i]|uniref:PaaI family thioesterase n=1 Tax=Oceanicola sp. 22II-s10i TaxID=1317116 RepID=UPI000B5260D4|nr:PaaI family thioesterase [Oceanicola sp. 22II-s10i]OWU83250.1 thioesterase [Oceanicola sp. 22II-s10i]
MSQLSNVAATAPGMTGVERQQETIAGRRQGPGIWQVLGLRLESAEVGRATLVATPGAELANPGGGLHGGFYGTFLDSCMASAVSSTLAAGQGSTTLEFKVNIIRPIMPGTPVRAIGVAQHVGRSTGIATGEIRGIEDDKLYATGSTTCMVFQIPANA